MGRDPKVIAALRQLLPDCVATQRDEATGRARKVVDLERLGALLGDRAAGSRVRERYGLEWPGKRAALSEAKAPARKLLVPEPDKSLALDTTGNLFIEGDNLEALKRLRDSLAGQVKVAYLDPPYNTGSDFLYGDDFSEDVASYLRRAGRAAGRKRVGKRAEKELAGRFHAGWLSMMAPRLQVARELLRPDGVIFVSCDESEQPQLRLLLDELFGAENFVADLVWAAGRKNDAYLVSVSHEYVVCYARNHALLREQKVRWRQRKRGLDAIYAEHRRLLKLHGEDFATVSAGLKAFYKALPGGHPAKDHEHYCWADGRGVYFASDISWPGGGGPRFPVLHPVTGKRVKVPARGWMTSDPEKMQAWVAEGRVHFGADHSMVPYRKLYLEENETQVPYSVFYRDGRAASQRLRALMGGNMFEFPKDERVLQELVAMATSGEDVVLDAFAGSASTAHAVMAQNAADGGRRRFVLVQAPERCAPRSAAAKAGYRTIAELGRERVRRAGAVLVKAREPGAPPLDVGFRAMRLE